MTQIKRQFFKHCHSAIRCAWLAGRGSTLLSLIRDCCAQVMYGIAGINTAIWLAWRVPRLNNIMNRHFLLSHRALAEGRWHTLLAHA